MILLVWILDLGPCGWFYTNPHPPSFTGDGANRLQGRNFHRSFYFDNRKTTIRQPLDNCKATTQSQLAARSAIMWIEWYWACGTEAIWSYLHSWKELVFCHIHVPQTNLSLSLSLSTPFSLLFQNPFILIQDALLAWKAKEHIKATMTITLSLPLLSLCSPSPASPWADQSRRAVVLPGSSRST